MSGERWGDAATEVAAGGGVGVPELIPRILEGCAEIGARGVEPHGVEHPRKGHLDIKVILLDRVRERLGLDFGLEHHAFGAKLRLRAVRHANHLPGPGALDLVAQRFARKPPGLRRLFRRW